VINGYGAGLYDQHAAMLEASKITPEQARARGYVSIDGNNRAMLAEIGIVKAARTDGLLIPLLRLDGSVAGYQHRPDNPRVKDGKEIKYETPYRQSNMIDFPPGVAERIQDRNVPIWITEGVKKGDAGACAGLAIVDIPGVWNWVGAGGVPLPDFRDLGLADREVILCFDSDTAVKPEVRKALTELAGWLKVSKRAKIKILLPTTQREQKDRAGRLPGRRAHHRRPSVIGASRPTQDHRSDFRHFRWKLDPAAAPRSDHPRRSTRDIPALARRRIRP
jgi:hypothetical protein